MLPSFFILTWGSHNLNLQKFNHGPSLSYIPSDDFGLLIDPDILWRKLGEWKSSLTLRLISAGLPSKDAQKSASPIRDIRASPRLWRSFGSLSSAVGKIEIRSFSLV